MSELKRCPFCGDEVEIVPTGLYHWKYAIHHKSKTECILDANAFALPYEEEDAVRMWNTREERKVDIAESYLRGWNNALDAVKNGKFVLKDSSEKPNNCEECKHWSDTEDGCADRHGCRATTEDSLTVPTCSVNGRPYDCGNCEYFKCTADEPQTERSE